MSRSPSPIDLSLLPSMPLADLRATWAEHMGRATPPSQKRLLIRELAWRIQERQHGGFDVKTRRLLNAAIRNALNSDAAERAEGSATTTGAPKRASPTRVATPALQPHTRLVRVWHGEKHEVVVLEGGEPGGSVGFRYRDRVYGSLTEISRAITGVNWSGPRFFGLRTRMGKAGT
jgi:hypothetical protein